MGKLTGDVVLGFVNSCLVKNFDGSLQTPDFHKEMWDLCCSPEKLVAVGAPRGHAKSTGITLSYTMAAVLFRERKFVIIVSDTESQAIMFLSQIKTELSENEDIVTLFGIKKDPSNPEKVRFSKDTESDVIIEFDDGHRCRIIAKGAEQRLRGLLWNGGRPDLVVIDDLENEELTMNKERREKLKRWFYAALMPCLSINGIIRYVGTILHMDSMLENLMPKPHQRGYMEDGLKIWTEKRVAGWKSVKYKAHNADYSQILWPAKWTAEKLREERQKYVDQGMPDLYSQEYLNIPIDDSVAFFKRSDLVAMTAADKTKKMNYYVAVDLAISEKERADYSAFVVGGVDEDNLLHINHVIRGRMDGQEIVETILALQRKYNPVVFGIEDMQVSKAIGPFLREEMQRTGIYASIIPLKPHRQDKITRARSIQARFRAGGVRVDKDAPWYGDYEAEMLSFPRARNDDMVDSTSYLGLLIDSFISAPTKEEDEKDEYDEEMRESGLLEQGRSATCGY